MQLGDNIKDHLALTYYDSDVKALFFIDKHQIKLI